MSKEQRGKERAAWRELQIVICMYRALGYDYVINRPSQTSVCFGSTVDRDTCPLKTDKMNALMRRIVPKHLDTSKSPPVLLKKTTDKRKSAIFKSSIPRFLYKTSNGKLFSPNDNIKATKINPVEDHKSNYESMVNFVTPSPGTYNIGQNRKYTYYDSFGGKKLLIPATKTLCIPNPTITCDECGLKVKGDFWQKISPLCTYCKRCMDNEKIKAKYGIKKKDRRIRRLAELNSFNRSQDCTFYHGHGGTDASVKLLPRGVSRARIVYKKHCSVVLFTGFHFIELIRIVDQKLFSGYENYNVEIFNMWMNMILHGTTLSSTGFQGKMNKLTPFDYVASAKSE